MPASKTELTKGSVHSTDPKRKQSTSFTTAFPLLCVGLEKQNIKRFHRPQGENSLGRSAPLNLLSKPIGARKLAQPAAPFTGIAGIGWQHQM